jgi:hypothetical protein
MGYGCREIILFSASNPNSHAAGVLHATWCSTQVTRLPSPALGLPPLSAALSR